MRTDDESVRVWFLPDIFWQVTKGMPPDRVDQLMLEVERLAEVRDFPALRGYSFIYIGESSHRREEELASLVATMG